MSGFLLDTNCISELVRVRPDPNVLAWARSRDQQQLFVSVLTLGEIRKGATLLPESSKRSQLEHWLEIDLPARFSDRILPINAPIAEIWGGMAAEARRRGVALAIIDGLIAATARRHELTIVTRNVRDFKVWATPVLNPWDTA